MATLEERVKSLRQAFAVMLGVMRSQGQDIRKIFERLDTIEEQLGTIGERFSRLEAKVDKHGVVLNEHTALLNHHYRDA